MLNKVMAHMLKGLMVHNQLCMGFRFLNLCGYAYQHKQHFLSEYNTYHALCDFYCRTYNRLPQKITSLEIPELIPSNWFNHVQADVDPSTKRSGIKKLMNAWIDWEKEAIEVFKEAYSSLINEGDINAAYYISELLRETSEELAGARSQLLDLESIDYDLSLIIDEQNRMMKND